MDPAVSTEVKWPVSWSHYHHELALLRCSLNPTEHSQSEAYTGL